MQSLNLAPAQTIHNSQRLNFDIKFYQSRCNLATDIRRFLAEENKLYLYSKHPAKPFAVTYHQPVNGIMPPEPKPEHETEPLAEAN